MTNEESKDRSSLRRDRQDLAAFGYKQELKRTLGRFSSFAAGFSYISILTGLFQMFYLGFGAGGPAFFWTWPMVFAGQFLVALCFAELAAQYPLSGSVYQWSKQLGHRAAAWMAGWIYLASLVITLAAVALALQITLPQISPSFQLVGNASDPADQAKNAVLLGCVLIAFTTVINTLGVGLLAKINNIGVFTELIGVVLLIVLLAGHSVRGPDVTFETQSHGSELPSGYLWAFLAAAAQTASYVMYGFDTAGSLAEETHDPRRTAPWAILQALAIAAAIGAFLLMTALLAAPDIHDPQLSQGDGGLPLIVNATLGKELGAIFLCDVIFAITVCALAVHTGTVRLMFSMARDNNLPFSKALSHVSGRVQTPTIPALVVGVSSSAILALNLNYPKVIEIVTSVAILWANLAYLFVTVLLLYQRLVGWPAVHAARQVQGFTLGRWGLPINSIAVLWGMFMIANIGWPRLPPETIWYERYAAWLLTLGLVMSGVLYYGLVQRYKTEVLPEHRAASER